jgi:creatinine amidohydrolase
MTAQPHPVIILQGDSKMETELVSRSLAMLREARLEAFVIQVAAPPLLSIFGFEAALNRLVFEVMRHRGVDQINWPGKGRDDRLYGFCVDV